MRLPFFRKRSNTKQITLANVHDILTNGLLGLNYQRNNRQYTNADYRVAQSIVRPVSDAINKITDNTLVIEPKLWNKITKEYVDQSPVLALLNNPNSFFNYTIFIKTLVINYLTYGNAYYIVGFIGSKPVTLSNVDTQCINIEINDIDGFVDKYTITQQYSTSVFTRSMENGRIVFRDEYNRLFIQIRDSSTKDDWRLQGESKINAIMSDVDLYQAVYLYNQSILDNQGRPSGIFKTKENIIFSDEQLAHLSEQWKALYSGANNSGKLLIAPPGLEYEQLSLSPKDIEYGQILDVVTKGVYNTFNIPLSLIESTALSLANMEVAMSHFYMNAVIPTIKVMFDSFTSQLLPFFVNDWQQFVITYDERTIPALRGVQLDDLTKEVALNVLTINEIRAALNRPQISNGDEVWAPSDLQPIGQVEDADGFIDEDDDGNNEA